MTQAHNQLLAMFREGCRDKLEDGVLGQETEWETVQVHCRIAGSLDVIRQLQNLEYDQLISGIEQ